MWTELLNGQADAVGLLNLSHAYLKGLASLLPGAHVKESPRPNGWYVGKGGTNITIEDLLAHEDGWLDAIQEFCRTAEDALKSVAPLSAAPNVSTTQVSQVKDQSDQTEGS